MERKDCENNKCNTKPTDSINYVFPVTVEIIHNEHKSAKTRYSAAETGGDVLVARDVDARRIGRQRQRNQSGRDSV